MATPGSTCPYIKVVTTIVGNTEMPFTDGLSILLALPFLRLMAIL